MVGLNPPKNQTQVGHKKEISKLTQVVWVVVPTLLGPKRLAKFQNESSTKKGEYLMI